ncbi:MAG: MinD/ParA family protein [Methylococcales bacterium]
MNQAKPVRVFAVISGKGGVGKTNVSVNLSVSLAESGKNVVLLDADLGLANVDVILGLQSQFNLSHVLSGEKSLREVMIEGPGGIKVIPASSGLQNMADLSQAEQGGLIRAFSEIDKDLDVLVVDTAAGISSSVVNFTRACQEIVVVVCDEPASLTDAYAFIKLLNRDYGIYNFQILTNQVEGIQQGQNLYKKLCRVTDRYLDVTLQFMGAVPYDECLRKAVQKQSPVMHSYPSSPSARAFRDLARKIEGWPVASQGSGHMEFFIERMLQYNCSQSELAI